MIRTTVISVVAALAAAVAPAAWGQAPDAFERAVNAQQRPSNVSIYPDAFQRAVDNGVSSSSSTIPGDHHERIAADVVTPAVPVVSSGRDVEWDQIGIGFAMGAFLTLGLMLTFWLSRRSALAH
jgi:hypothetical protein